MMNRDTYVGNVEKILNTIQGIGGNPTLIPRVTVCDVWNATDPSRLTVPGYWMSDAMEAWGKRNGYTLVWSTTKHGKRRNVMLVKNQ
jgi:hypothetical protein